MIIQTADYTREFKILIDNLIIRHRKSTDADIPENLESLEELRTKIDDYDNIIFDYLNKRMAVAKNIGTVKKKSNITILQTDRRNKIMENAVKKGKELGLSAKFVNKFFQAIHQESVQQQTEIYIILSKEQ